MELFVLLLHDLKLLDKPSKIISATNTQLSEDRTVHHTSRYPVMTGTIYYYSHIIALKHSMGKGT